MTRGGDAPKIPDPRIFTIVGGLKKRGGPDPGPARARAAWATLGVNGKTLPDAAPAADFVGMPRLMVQMVARLQGFPDDWAISGRKTAAYRQVGNAFPPADGQGSGGAAVPSLGWSAHLPGAGAWLDHDAVCRKPHNPPDPGFGRRDRISGLAGQGRPVPCLKATRPQGKGGWAWPRPRQSGRACLGWRVFAPAKGQAGAA